MSPTAPPARPGAPRNRLGAVTFVVVVLAAILAVFPATARFGFLLCLLALVPAFLAYRRTRKGTATNQGRSFAAVLMAPAFLIVALVMGANTAPAEVQNASDTSALAASAPVAAAAPAPLLAAPAPVPVPAAAVPSDAARAVVLSTVPPAPPTSGRPSTAAATRPAPAVQAAAASAPVVKKVADPAPPKAPPRPSAQLSPKMAPVPPAPDTGSAVTCDPATHYVNDDGDCVHRPSTTGGGSPTFRCKDGTYSYSEHRQGTCSGHKGIEAQL